MTISYLDNDELDLFTQRGFTILINTDSVNKHFTEGDVRNFKNCNLILNNQHGFPKKEKKGKHNKYSFKK